MAGATLRIEQRVWDALDAHGGSGEGNQRVFLLGREATVVGAVKFAAAEGGDWTDVVSEIVAMLPVGLTCLGACVFGAVADGPTPTEAEKTVASLPRSLLGRYGDKFYVVFQSIGSASCYDLESGAFAGTRADVRAVPGELKRSSGYLRCTLDLPLQLVYSAKEDRDAAIDRAVERAATDIRSNAFEFLYKVRKDVDGEEAYQSGFFNTSLDDFSETSGTLDDPLVLELFASASKPAPEVAPILRYAPTSDPNFQCETLDLHLDAVVMVPRAEAFDAAAKEAVVSKLVDQARFARKTIAASPNEKSFKFHHFSPDLLNYLVTVLYPDVGPDEMKLFKRRQELHEQLFLPLDRPLLRVSNALTWGAGGASFSKKLKNVHNALKSSGVKDGKQNLVKGDYCYFHYMQDRFDDAGWGCAYRSLQTIISWFVLNNYTNNKVPGHRDIQQTLVNIGDKPSTFVGSKQWIGAIEISFILDTLLDIASKVITFNSGAEIPTKAREIAHHFETQGTPIMIGGGVLAYTLLGIDYNDSTGECAFLILDPHYTEGEEIDKITGGTWVGWKRLGDNAAAGGDLFVKTAFYNFLCPQRPSTV